MFQARQARMKAEEDVKLLMNRLKHLKVRLWRPHAFWVGETLAGNATCTGPNTWVTNQLRQTIYERPCLVWWRILLRGVCSAYDG